MCQRRLCQGKLQRSLQQPGSCDFWRQEKRRVGVGAVDACAVGNQCSIARAQLWSKSPLNALHRPSTWCGHSPGHLRRVIPQVPGGGQRTLRDWSNLFPLTSTRCSSARAQLVEAADERVAPTWCGHSPGHLRWVIPPSSWRRPTRHTRLEQSVPAYLNEVNHFHATIRRCQTPPGAALGNSDDMAYRFVRSMRSGDWYARTTC